MHFSVLPNLEVAILIIFKYLMANVFLELPFILLIKELTGSIIDVVKFKINKNDTAFENYSKLLKKSSFLFKKILEKY